MRIINVHEAKTHLSQILGRGEGGEEVILAKMGKPYARLLPIEPIEQIPLGFVPGAFDESFFEPLPDELLELWEGGPR